MTLLLKLSIDMSIQSQALSVHALPSQLYMYIMTHKEKAPIYKLSRSKVFKTQQICHYRKTRKTRVPFSLYDIDIDFSYRNYLANSGSLAKVSVPVRSIIPWFPCIVYWQFSQFPKQIQYGSYIGSTTLAFCLFLLTLEV